MLSSLLDSIPFVESDDDRNARYPNPRKNFRVQYSDGTIKRYTGAAWVVMPASSASLARVSSQFLRGDAATDDKAALDTLVNVTMQPDGGELDLIGVPRIASNVTIPKNIKLNFRNGAYFAPDVGAVITIVGDFDQSLVRKFGGGGTISFVGNPFVKEIYPQWWAPAGYVAGVTEALPMITSAMAAALVSHKHPVMLAPQDYLVDTGRVDIPQGVTVLAHPSMGEYDGNPYARGARLIRSAAGTAAQPLVQLNTSSSCLGPELRWQKPGGALQGVLRMGIAGTFITYARFKGSIRGTRTGDTAGGTTCYGIKFPDSADAKFFNDIDAYVTECDVSCRLGQMANANTIRLMSREAHLHLELNALAGQSIENEIYLRAFAITVIANTGIKMRGAVNNKIRGVYEAYGTCFDIDSVTAGSNDINMTVNEANPSYVPDTSTDRRYTQPVNRSRYSSMTLPTRLTGDRNIFGRGNKVSFLREITGVLPNANNPAGTLIAADANNRVILNFGPNFTKPSLISFKARLALWIYLPFNHSMHFVEVEFLYRNTNQSTGAGQLSVLRVTQKGGDITGLYFLTGVTGGTNFAIALTLGNLGAATPPDVISCELDIFALTYSTNVITMDDLASQPSFATAAVTANDVANKISLLVVADTAV